MLRFAPSPTGDMEIGNLRVALFNHILSKQLNEELLVRIDDTGKERNIEGKDKEILEILSLFGIDYSRVVHQSENIKYHTGMGMKLLLDKKAFNCFCSDEALEADREKAKKEGKTYSYSGFCETISDEAKFQCNAPFVVRIKKPGQNIKFTDGIKGELEYEPSLVDSFVILGHDKTPTCNFACGVDDMLYDISVVIRSEENLLNTPKQIHVRESLGYGKEIKYIHLPEILKEEGSLSVKSLIDGGYLPSAVANYLVMLGYTPPKEIFTIEEAVEWFDIDKVSDAPAKFDINKLNFINKEHLKTMEELRLSKILGYADEDIGRLAKIYLQECNTIKEIKEKISGIFGDKNTLEGFQDEFGRLRESLQKAPFIEDFEALKEYLTEKTGLEGEKLSIPLRYALTGEVKGPDLGGVYPLIRNYLGEII